MTPAQQVLTIVIVGLHVMLPLVTWLVFTSQAPRTLRLWFVGGTLYAGAVLAALLRAASFQPLLWVASTTLSLAAVLLLIRAVQVARGAQERPWPAWIGIAILVWSGCAVLIEGVGAEARWGTLIVSCILALLEIVLWIDLWRLRRQVGIRAILVMELGVVIAIATHLLRVILIIASDWHYALYGGDWQSGAIALGFTLCFVLLYSGGWGYLVESTRRDEMLATLRESETERARRVAEENLRERDALLLSNARYAAAGTMAVYTATIVHEISQPLQTIRIALQSALSNLERHSRPQEAIADLREALDTSDAAADILHTLRDLIRRGASETSAVPLGPSVAQVLRVIESEAGRRGVRFTYHDSSRGAAALCSEAMLHRVIFNLAGNALDALETLHNSSQAGELSIELLRRTDSGREMVCLRLCDNGPGFDPEILNALTRPYSTNKPGGTGLGLALTEALARQWGGRLSITSANAGGLRRTCVELLLPVLPPSAS